MSLYGLGAVVAPAVGPALGGYLVEYVDWRLIFFINVPVGILGAVATILVLPQFPGRVGQRFDLLGFVTVASGLFALLLALSKGEDWGWSSHRILGLFLFSAVSCARRSDGAVGKITVSVSRATKFVTYDTQTVILRYTVDRADREATWSCRSRAHH